MKADFSKIIGDSIKITRSNKKLWVMGLVLATLTAGSSGGGGGGGSSSDSTKTDKKEINRTIEKNSDLLNSNLLSSRMPQVLGATTSTLTDLAKTIPASFYFALVIVVMFGIALGIAISLYGQAWSQSGLIRGIEKQSIGEALGLAQMSDHGKTKALEVIKIRVLPGLIFMCAALGTGLVPLILAIVLGTAGKIVGILLGIPWVLAFIIGIIIVSASSNLGILAINLEALTWKDGYKRGFQVFRKYFFDVLIMSIINCFAGCLFGVATLITLAVLGGIGLACVFGVIAFPPFLIAAGPIIFLAILALIILLGLAGAIFTVFKQSTWVLLYKQLTEVTNGQH